MRRSSGTDILERVTLSGEKVKIASAAFDITAMPQLFLSVTKEADLN